MASLGIVEPIRGRWIWPLREMEVGDWFHVANELRNPDALRNYMHTAARRLGMHISVTGDDPEKPGFARVERVAQPGGKQRNETNREVVDYGLVRDRLEQSYQLSLDLMRGWAELKIGESIVYGASMIEEPPRDRLVFHLPAEDGQRFGVTMKSDHVMIERIDDEETLSDWIAREALS